MMTKTKAGHCCVNCTQVFDSPDHPRKAYFFRELKDDQPRGPLLSTTTFNDRRFRVKRMEQVQVVTVISKIYKLGFLDTLKNAQEDEEESKNFALCLDCIGILAKLYELYDTFNQLCKADSYLSTKIEQLNSGIEQLRGSLQLNNESSAKNDHGDAGSCDVIIKEKEGEDEDEIDLENLQRSDITVHDNGAEASRSNNMSNCNGQPSSSSSRHVTPGKPKNSGQQGKNMNMPTFLSTSSVPAQSSTLIIPVVAAVTLVNPPEVNTSKSTNQESSDWTQDLGSVTDEEEEIEMEKLVAKVESHFTCPRCYKEFPSLSTMEFHYQIYHLKKTASDITHNIGSSKTKKDKNASDPLQLSDPLFIKPGGLDCTDPHCGSSFLSQLALEQHSARSRHGDKYFHCTDCPLSFYTKSEAAQHYAIHATGKALEIECHKCSAILNTKEDLKVHMSKDHPNRKRKKEASLNSKGQKLTTKKPTKNQSFSCPEEGCDKSFTTKKVLEDHLIRHVTPKPYSCTKCPKTYSKMISLVNHQQEHFNFKCLHEKCHRRFNTEAEATHHFLKCSGQPDTFLCDLCAKVFMTRTAFRSHKLLHHERGKQFKCSHDDCSKTFYLKRQLQQHEQIHASTRPFACPTEGCEKTFVAEYPMKVHIKNCHEEKSHLCPHCGRTFSRKQQFRCHVATHSKERPFVCDVCNNSFKTIPILKSHQMIHADKKRFVCSFPGCGKTCTLSKHLKRHIQTHTGEKPYVCKKCGMSFPDNRPLKKHLLTHEEEDD